MSEKAAGALVEGPLVAETDSRYMAEALDLSARARRQAPPNPWVGCVIVSGDGQIVGRGATEAPPGRHAEVVALSEAGARAEGATVYVTLEPCATTGRTPPCADALVAARVARVVVAVIDPDERVFGAGIAILQAAGIETTVGVLADEAEELLSPYLTHRRTGRPLVVLKLAATFDGRIAAPDGTSKWVTGEEARRDAHELRADSDAILVGAGTVRADDPELTVRLDGVERQPLRVVLGRAPERAKVLPAFELSGDLRGVLDELGRRQVLQLLVEGGSHVAGEFHRLGLVDRYVFYLAPVLLGGDDGVAAFGGSGAATMKDAWRGSIVSTKALGPDLRVDLVRS